MQKAMDTTTTDAEIGDFSDSFGLATWNRPRSTEELQDFINRRHELLPDTIDLAL
jgi:hypothetical protein